MPVMIARNLGSCARNTAFMGRIVSYPYKAGVAQPRQGEGVRESPYRLVSSSFIRPHTPGSFASS